MPREARRDYPGALQHVCMRGIERRPIFHDDDDRERFLRYLGKVLGEEANPCLAWALMPNHVHLLVESRGAPLHRVMRRLGTRYALAFNRRHGRVGHLFQNRYFSKPVERDDYVVTAACYILRNPLRAGIVPDLAALESYPWTGYPTLLGRCRRRFEDTDGLLKYLGRSTEQGRIGLRARMAEVETPSEAWEVPLPAIESSPRGVEVEATAVMLPNRLQDARDLRAGGWDLDRLIREVTRVLGVEECELRAGRRLSRVSEARALVAHFGYERLDYPLAILGRATGVGGMAMSLSLTKGRNLAKAKGLRILPGGLGGPVTPEPE